MKISNREMILGLATVSILLFGFTYWMAGSKIAEQREIASEKVRLLRQIKLHQKILAEKENWIGALDSLQARLPVYDRKIPVTVQLPKEIKRIADQHGLDLPLTQPEGEEQIGSLYELRVRCDWQGSLEAVVHFLYDLHTQGVRFDVRQINIKPIAKKENQLKGSMIINCAYRRAEDEKQQPDEAKPMAP